MSYVVLARKWRPQSFEDLVGQEHVSTTLGNAIARNRVAHAFLFTGVRGVGKTTSARILAKALNCVNGPTAKPCQTCAPCTEITTGADVDVQEIDGASYNGVDEVRKLQESLPYRPARDRFKIFIVDEVHMLSNAAWNAFLKTLEEPPPHVKFIFATTEVHKVPVTILSRCQRYDFKLLTAQAIAARLRWVLEQEQIPAEDAALTALAREAAGSMRDAMSLLDQVIAWVGVSGDRLTGEGVAKVLGVADRVVLHRLAEALVGGDPATCLRIVGELSQQGYDLPHVARDILAHLRDLVVAKVCDDPGALLDLADAELADVRALAARSDADDLTRLHQGFSRAFDDIVRSGQPRASLEMALVRLARRPPLLPIDELLRRLGDLERRLGGGGAPPGAAPDRSPQRPGGPPPGAPPRRSAAPAEAGPLQAPGLEAPGETRASPRGGSAQRRAESAAPAEPARPPHGGEGPPQAWAADGGPGGPAPDGPARPENGAPAGPAPDGPARPENGAPARPAPDGPARPENGAPARPAPDGPARPENGAPARPAPDGPARPAPDGPARPANGAPARPANGSSPPGPWKLPAAVAASLAGGGPAGSSPPPSDGLATGAAPMPGPAPAPRSSPPMAADASLSGRRSSPPSSMPEMSVDLSAWRAVIASVQRQRPPLASVLEHAALLEFAPARVALGFENSFLAAQATEGPAREVLVAAVRAHFGCATEVVFDTVTRGNGGVTVAQVESAERRARVEAARKAVVEHPLVTAAIELLGAEIKDVRLGQEFADG